MEERMMGTMTIPESDIRFSIGDELFQFPLGTEIKRLIKETGRTVEFFLYGGVFSLLLDNGIALVPAETEVQKEDGIFYFATNMKGIAEPVITFDDLQRIFS